MPAIPFTATDGTTVLVNPNGIMAVIPVADNQNAPPNPSCRIVSFAGPANNVEVLGDALSIVTALGTLGAMVPLPIAQAISGPTPFSGPDAYIQQNGPIPFLESFTIPNDPAPYTRIAFVANGDVIVGGDPVVVAGLLLTGFGPSGPGPEARIAGQGYVDGAGTILGFASDSGYGLIPTAPHVPNSGVYAFSLTGTPPGFGYIIVLSFPGFKAAYVARPVALGSPDFIVELYLPTRTWAAGRGSAGGGMIQSLNLDSVLAVPGSGAYACTITTPTPPGLFSAVVSSEEPGKAAVSSWSGPDTFDVQVTDVATGLPVDGSWSATVTGTEPASEGFPPQDAAFFLTVVRFS